MDEMIEIRFNEDERRIEKCERDFEDLKNQVNRLDKSYELVSVQLSIMSKQLEKLDSKFDDSNQKIDKILLERIKPEEILNKDKATKWDKLVWLIIAECVGTVILLLKTFIQ